MGRLILILGLVLSTKVAMGLSPKCSDCTSDSKKIVTGLEADGFDCNFGDVSLKRAYRCKGKVPNYPMPIDIFVSPLLNIKSTVTVAYHLHGWWQNPKSTPFDGEDGDFGVFLAESRRNIILVIPESSGKNSTYKDYLSTPKAMNSLFKEIEGRLVRAGAGLSMTSPRLLSGHSGAYVQMAKMGDWAVSGEVPYLRTLRGVALLDTAYGYREGLIALMDVQCRNDGAEYLIAYNPSDGSSGKRATNERLIHEATGSHTCGRVRVDPFADSGTNHVGFPRKYLAQFFEWSAVW